MNLIVGLGNPGRAYSHNRHNIGFICLNHFARTHGIKFNKKQAQARTGSGEVAGRQVILARPQTYMNQSGRSVGPLVKKFKIDLDNLLVIHDELDLPLGRIRIRQGSSSGGHKGIDSIISYLGSQGFIRIRIGIGHPRDDNYVKEIGNTEVISHVLSDFTSSEEKIISRILEKTNQAILCLLTDDLTTAMNRYNRIDLSQ